MAESPPPQYNERVFYPNMIRVYKRIKSSLIYAIWTAYTVEMSTNESKDDISEKEKN